MKPVYVFRNVQTNNIITFSNARLAHETYRELCISEDATYFAYSTFRVYWKKKTVLRFLNYLIERPYLIGNQDNDLGGNIEHLTTSQILYFPKYIRPEIHGTTD